MSSTSEFRVWVRREPGYDVRVGLRFEVSTGAGAFVLQGHPDPQLAAHGTAEALAMEAVRGGRFLHVPQGTERREGYALTRLEPDDVARLAPDEWVPLAVQVEFGFRYLVLAQPLEASRGAQVRIGPPPSPAALPARGATPGPAPRRLSAPRTAEREPPPEPSPAALPRPLAMEADLAEKLLRNLTAEQARNWLRVATERNSELYRAIEERDRALEASRAREADLLELLARWQRREGG